MIRVCEYHSSISVGITLNYDGPEWTYDSTHFRMQILPVSQFPCGSINTEVEFRDEQYFNKVSVYKIHVLNYLKIK